MTKIIMVCGRSPVDYYGGIENHVLQISKRLVKKGHEIEIYSTFPPASIETTEFTDYGILIRKFPALAPRETYYLSLSLYRALKEAECDILHAHGVQDFAFLCAALVKKPEQKLVLTLHSAGSSSYVTRLLNVPYRFVLHKALKKADSIICVSEAEYHHFKQYLGLPSRYFSVISNGVDLEEISQKVDCDIFDKNTRFILTISRLEKYKGCQHILRGFARLRCSNNTKLVVVGSGSYKNALQKLAQRLGVEKNTLFLEKVSRDKMASLYKNCEFFTLLSKYESNAICVMEALATEKPVLVADTSALSEFVKKGLAVGVPYPPKPEIVSEKMREILDDPSKFVHKDANIPNWSDVVDQLISAYLSLLRRI